MLETQQVAPYPRLDHDQTGTSPGYRVYEACDGWVAIVALDDPRRAALRAVAGVGTDAELVEALRTRAAAELLDDLGAHGVPAELVAEQQYRSVWDDPENRRSGMVTTYEQADWGTMDQFGAFWCFGDVGSHSSGPVPPLASIHARSLWSSGSGTTRSATSRGSGW